MFDWSLRTTGLKKRITVHSMSIPNNPWQVIKSDCVVRGDIHEICSLLMDDARSKDYDDCIDEYEVLQRHAAYLSRYFSF